jgi:hypothetical protein
MDGLNSRCPISAATMAADSSANSRHMPGLSLAPLPVDTRPMAAPLAVEVEAPTRVTITQQLRWLTA